MAAGLILFFGPTGAGKTLQAKLLAERHGFLHLSSGAMLRATHDPKLTQMMQEGELVPSKEVQRLVGNAIDAADPKLTIVLDGFPRTLEEVEWLESRLTEAERSFRVAVNINVDREESLERILKRGRKDDSAESLGEKWDEYQEQTLPVLDYYRQKGVLKEVDGMGSEEEISRRVQDVL